MRNPKIAILRYVQPKRLSYDIASISETTTPIDNKLFSRQYLHNENVSGDAVL